MLGEDTGHYVSPSPPAPSPLVVIENGLRFKRSINGTAQRLRLTGVQYKSCRRCMGVVGRLLSAVVVMWIVEHILWQRKEGISV